MAIMVLAMKIYDNHMKLCRYLERVVNIDMISINSRIMAAESRIALTTMLSDLKTGVEKMHLQILENLDHFKKFLDQYSTIEEGQLKKLKSKIKTNNMTVKALGDSLEALSVRTLSLQAPVSRDLRVVMSSFRMIYDLERISQNTLNAFRSVARISSENQEYFLMQVGLLRDSFTAVEALMKEFYGIYGAENIERHFDYSAIITSAIEQDDVIDNLFENHSKKIIKAANTGEIQADDAHYLLASIRSLERVGDHCCNLIEKAIYMQSGDRVTIY